MTTGDIAQVIIASAALLASLTSAAALVVSVRNGRKIEQVHVATNSMKDELVAVTRKDALAEGLKEGREETRP